MIDLGRLLPKMLDAAGTKPEMSEIAAKLAWRRAAGEGLRRHAIPFRLNQKTLIVSVADTMWQKQLQSMAAELVFRINRLLGRNLVDFVEFRVDPAVLDHARVEALQPEQPESEARTPVPAELISVAGSIADQDLRRQFLRAAENCITRRELRSENEVFRANAERSCNRKSEI